VAKRTLSRKTLSRADEEPFAGPDLRLTADGRLALGPQEIGATGTANSFGDLLTEYNPALTYQQGYGTPGSRSWGAWEYLRRTNPWVAQGLEFVASPIRDASIGVQVATHESLPEELAAKQADFVRWALTEALSPAISDLLQSMTKSGLNDGFELRELVWGSVKHPSLPGGIGNSVVRLAERLPSTLIYQAWHEENGQLVGVRQRAPFAGAWRIVEIPVEKVSLFSWGRTGNNYAGYSVWRPVFYITQVQEQILKMLGITLTREGAGVPTAVSQGADAANLNDKQRKALARLLQNLVYHENASVVMPRGWDIKWVYSPGANKSHVLEAWRDLGIVVLQMVGAQQLTLGTGGTGSRAVGQTHDAQSLVFVQSVVAALESCLNGRAGALETGLVRKLVDANWGPQPAYPKLTISLKRPQLGPLEKMQAVQAAVGAGALTVTADDENAFREDLGLEPIDAEARDEEKAKRAALRPPVAAVPPGQPAQTPNDDSSPGQSPAARAPADKEENQLPLGTSRGACGCTTHRRLARGGQPFTPSRALRPGEERLDLAAIDSFLNSARHDFEQRVRPVVVEMLVKAQPAIHRAMAEGKPADVAKVPLDTSRLSDAIDAFLTACRAEGNRQVRGELRKGAGPDIAEKRAEGEPAVAPTKLAAAGDDEDDEGKEADNSPEEEADELLQHQRDALLRRMESRLEGQLEQEAIDAKRTGGDASEVVSRTVEDQLDSGAFRADAGTVVTKAWNAGRDEAAKQLGGVAAVQYSAILDGKQCDECAAMDGATADFESAEHDAMVPPNRDCEGGDNCRCCLVYLTADQAPNDGSDE
jgi:hypothetical protein